MLDSRDDLVKFLAVAETGKILAAAERLAITQPALSRTIARLEARCSGKLFDRLTTVAVREGCASLLVESKYAAHDIRPKVSRRCGRWAGLRRETLPASPAVCIPSRETRGSGLREADTMERDYERELRASLAKAMAVMCFRNTVIEDFYAGTAPVSHTGDFSDVVVIDADGRRIPWPEVAHIEQSEMRALMRQVVDRLYTFQVKADDLHFIATMDRAGREAREWDEPQLDEIFLARIEASRERGQG